MARGWKGNALGLARWEVEQAHQARIDATEAVADLMRQGKPFIDARAEIVKRAARIYSVHRPNRPELYEGTMRCVRDVRFSDMPRDITGKVEQDFRASIERVKGKPLGMVDRLLWRWFGLVW